MRRVEGDIVSEFDEVPENGEMIGTVSMLHNNNKRTYIVAYWQFRIEW